MVRTNTYAKPQTFCLLNLKKHKIMAEGGKHNYGQLFVNTHQFSFSLYCMKNHFHYINLKITQ